MHPPVWISERIGSQLGVCRRIESPRGPVGIGPRRSHRKEQFSSPAQGLRERPFLGFCESFHAAIEIVGNLDLGFDHGSGKAPSK